MIFGVGVDLVDISRMKRSLNTRCAESFMKRVFSAEEIAAVLRAARPVEAMAARFAAKEALAKALGTGFSRGIAPGGIVVRRTETSRPSIELIGPTREAAIAMRIGLIHVSLTHTPSAACAMVVVESL